METIEAIRIEMDRAQVRYGDYTSTHEALGVLTEEVAELVEAIRSNALGAVQREAVQVAAVAARLAQACTDAVAADLGGDMPAFMARSIK